MARRRRSLLDSKGGSVPSSSDAEDDSADSGDEATPSERDEGTENEASSDDEASAGDLAAASEGEPAAGAAADGPVIEEKISVSEPTYSQAGRMAADTDDAGWTGSVHDTDSYGDPGFGSSDNWGVFDGGDDGNAAKSPAGKAPDKAEGAGPKTSETASEFNLDEFDPMAEFFGQPYADFEAAGEPPTEEVPSGVMEDLQEMYDSPMHVPEPPQVPGIADRYTPAPVKRREGPTADEDRPVFEPLDAPLPGDTPAPTPRKVDKAPTPIPDLRQRVDLDEDEGARDEGGGGLPMSMILAGVGGVLVLAIVALLGFLLMGGLGGGGDQPDRTAVGKPEPVAPVGVPVNPEVKIGPDGLPIRSGLQGTPDDDTEEDTDEVEDPEVEPDTKVEEAPKPAPVAAPVPKPRPKPRPAPEPVAKLGTLKVRANRKVLITINGKPEDYAPLDMPLSPGTYAIGAALPGRPDSEQVMQVTLDAGEVERVEFTF